MLKTEFFWRMCIKGPRTVPCSKGFIEQLLPHCGPWPESKSVLVMDNASFHHSDRIEELCLVAGVRLLYLPPYSSDLNPVEKFFPKFKGFIKRRWQRHEGLLHRDFGDFLEWCSH
ncbi:TPR domain-containing protein [Verticillium dahliae]